MIDQDYLDRLQQENDKAYADYIALKEEAENAPFRKIPSYVIQIGPARRKWETALDRLNHYTDFRLAHVKVNDKT